MIVSQAHVTGTIQVIEHPADMEETIRAALHEANRLGVPVEKILLTYRPLTCWQGHNLVTTIGLDLIADRLRGNTGIAGIGYYAIGDSNAVPPAAGQTGLTSERFRDVLTATAVSAGGVQFTMFVGSLQGNGYTYVEGAPFNAENTMLARAIFPAKVKDASKTLTVIHTIQFAVT